MRLLLPLLLSVGCATTSSTTTADRAPDQGGTTSAQLTDTRQTTTPAPPALPPCPAKFGEPGPSCDGPTPQCDYPEGSCGCQQPRTCSGAARAPMQSSWLCYPPPRQCPQAGTPCEGSTSCGPECCGMGVVCQKGVWVARYFPCPP